MKKMKMFFIAVTLLSCSAGAQAQTLQLTSKHWRVFTATEGKNTLCYIASVPTANEGTFKQRGEPFLMVTHKSTSLDEVSVSSGYDYHAKKDVVVTLGSKKYPFFAQKDRAWAKDSATDTALVKEMRRGSRLDVQGVSVKDTTSKDTYSLSGFSLAYNKMKQLCE